MCLLRRCCESVLQRGVGVRCNFVDVMMGNDVIVRVEGNLNCCERYGPRVLTCMGVIVDLIDTSLLCLGGLVSQ